MKQDALASSVLRTADLTVSRAIHELTVSALFCHPVTRDPGLPRA